MKKLKDKNNPNKNDRKPTINIDDKNSPKSNKGDYGDLGDTPKNITPINQKKKIKFW